MKDFLALPDHSGQSGLTLQLFPIVTSNLIGQINPISHENALYIWVVVSYSSYPSSCNRGSTDVIRSRVHKETENEDQDQDQTHKLQLLDLVKLMNILPEGKI